MQPVTSASQNGLLGRSQSKQGSSSRLNFTHHAPNHAPFAGGNPSGEDPRSHTWTSSSENPDLPLDEDNKDDRKIFILEYNQLAQKVNIYISDLSVSWRPSELTRALAWDSSARPWRLFAQGCTLLLSIYLVNSLGSSRIGSYQWLA